MNYSLLCNCNSSFTAAALSFDRMRNQRARNYKWTPSLPEKAGGFTKRSYPEGHMVCCVALQTAPLNVYPYNLGLPKLF